MTGLLNIKKAISNLNPEQVRQLRDRAMNVGMRASSHDGFNRIESFLLSGLSPDRRRQSAALLRRDAAGTGFGYDLLIYDEATPAPPGSLVFHSDRPSQFLKNALERHSDLAVPLARSFPPFRRAFVDDVVGRTCRENTLFSLTTALPDVIPSFIELPWAVAEFASDTAFLTMNQLKMAFLIAAASDREVGYRQQKAEIASVIAGAFGWRAIARQVIGKIPFGGGLIAKAAVAYAGTKVVGLSLDYLYSVGYHHTRQERETLYAESLRNGRKIAGQILTHLRPDLAARFSERQIAKVPMVYPRADVR